MSGDEIRDADEVENGNGNGHEMGQEEVRCKESISVFMLIRASLANRKRKVSTLAISLSTKSFIPSNSAWAVSPTLLPTFVCGLCRWRTPSCLKCFGGCESLIDASKPLLTRRISQDYQEHFPIYWSSWRCDRFPRFRILVCPHFGHPHHYGRVSTVASEVMSCR